MADTRAASPTLPDQPAALPFDPVILLVAGALMTLGCVMVYSASVTVAGAELDWRRWWNTPWRQSVFALLGFGAMLFAAHCDYRWLSWTRRRDGWRAAVLYVLAALLLVAMLVVGTETLGAQRSIVVFRHPFPLSFQPAEPAKVILVIWLAALLARLQTPQGDRLNAPPRLHNLRRGFLPAVLSAGLLIGLTGVEDFGTAALMGTVTLALLFLAGARWWHMLSMGLLGLAGGVILLVKDSYRLQRLMTFFSEAPDPRGEGYQVDQSMLAIGSGGWFGRGLGAGVQKYGYLPQQNNDFILATVCEELGAIGGLVVIALFLVLLWRGWRLARRAPDTFGRLLAGGLTLLLCLQAAFNVGVVTNSVPTKGISLPFVSAGGSGVLFLGLAAGLLAAVGRPRAEPKQNPTARRRTHVVSQQT
ncbi:MAG: putative peptidoglycan glycosyltransferase FtsW [Phycisphaerae bacterium]|jgi:cell division protein FtsW